MGSTVSKDFEKQVQGYGLTTAHILYRRPYHRWLLQSYVWQAYDLFPKFPELQRFLDFWQERLEGLAVLWLAGDGERSGSAAVEGIFERDNLVLFGMNGRAVSVDHFHGGFHGFGAGVAEEGPL